MSEFPRTKVENLSLSRMIVGTNWFMGFSHTSQARDSYIKAVMTPSKIADILEVFLNAGVDTMMGRVTEEIMLAAIEEAQQRAGRKMIKIGTPHFFTQPGKEDPDHIKEVLDQQAAAGVSICMPHQCTTDALVDRFERKIRRMDGYCALIRQRGMIPGLSTHMPESVVYADETNLDVGTYIQIYNAAGFLMQVEVDWVHRIIQNAAKPVMTIKPMAAGRLLPLVGMAFNWATIRDKDMVAVGTLTPDEAKELIEISLSVLDRRSPEVPLQRTRSKVIVEPAKKN